MASISDRFHRKNNGRNDHDLDPTEPLEPWHDATGTDRAAWDDEGPTRVISSPHGSGQDDPTEPMNPAPSGGFSRGSTAQDDPTEVYSREEITASSYRPPATQQPQTPASGIPAESITAQRRQGNPYQAQQSYPGQQPYQAQQPYAAQQPADPYRAEEYDRAAAAKEKYSRIQFFPALLGWLAAYSLMTFSGYLQQALTSAFRLPQYDTFQQAFHDLIGSGQPPTGALWAWLLIAAALIVLSFAFGGYAAARMARYAPAKQGFGVWLWHVLATVIATICVFFGLTGNTTGTPQLSVQAMLTPNPMQALPGALITVLLVLIGSILGALFGPRYHRKLR